MILDKYIFELESSNDNILSFKLNNNDLRVKVFILEEDIIRVMFYYKNEKLTNSWMVSPGIEDIPKEGRNRLDLSGFNLPNYKIKETKKTVEIETSKLKVKIDLNGMKFNWFYKKDNKYIKVLEDRETQAYNIDNSLGDGNYHYIKRDIEDQYFGLGEKAGNTNRHGNRYIMKSVDPMGYNAKTSDPLYKHIPFYITRNRRDRISYGIFYDNLSTSIFDMGKELDNYHGYFRYYKSEGGLLDYYVIMGPEIKNVTEKFSWLTGKTIMPPKWSIGYSGSTMTYTDADNAQELLLEFIQECKRYDIPCDSFQLSSGYTSIGDKRYVFNWNYDKIPTPKEMTDEFHKNGMRLCANIKPAFIKDHPMYDELEEKEYFIKDRFNKKPEVVQFWDGLGSYLDFTNPDAYEWWKDKVKTELMEYGIDSTWNDNNEYEVWDYNAKSNGFGEKIETGEIRPVQGLLMMKASYEAQKEFAPNVRPYLISRSGCPGMQRYVQTWSGDNYTSWETIKYNIKMGIGLSLSGIYNIGHDVGGFDGEAPDPEMFLRWVQNGIFHPRFTIHSWNFDKTVNVPWMHPEITPIIRDLIKFRVKLTPLFYNLIYEANKEYKPIIRPTFYNFENDDETFKENDDFMLGDNILVASVVEEGKYDRDVYLPKNELGWYDYHTNIHYNSGRTITIPAPLSYTPLLVREGTIIPINDSRITFENKHNISRGFELFPRVNTGIDEYELYEDDGYTNNYREGEYTLIKLVMETQKDNVVIDIDVKGEFELPYETINIYLPKNNTRNIIINNVKYDYNNDNKYIVKIRDGIYE